MNRLYPPRAGSAIVASHADIKVELMIAASVSAS
jgi:hypothetical protein